MATRTAALGAVVGALNAAGFNANIDGNNNLTIAGNNIDTTANANGINLTSAVTNLTGAAGTNIGGVDDGDDADDDRHGDARAGE